jgi:isocitrate dehydrogenase
MTIAATKTRITVIEGDGIGPEVVQSTIKLLQAAGANLEFDYCLAGAKVFKMGNDTGVTEETVASILKNKIVLKGPLETPIGYGEKSANVTLRKLFETFANIRPVFTLAGVKTPFSDRNLDLVVVRENIEDLYAGIEYMQSPNVAQTLKIITRKGSEKIIRYAFELALSEGRSKVTCATKANIMKMSEGLFKKIFEEISLEYPTIKAEHMIIDNCAHQMVRKPEQFDVVVMTNMNGDIISDLTSGLVGGLGFAPSANIGSQVAMFEAVHGSAPDIAGQGKANPTALMLSGVLMLRHLGEFAIADKVEKAVLYTLEHSKAKTGDIAKPGDEIISTEQYTDVVISNLGKEPSVHKNRDFKPIQIRPVSPEANFSTSSVEEVGFDVFITADYCADIDSIAQDLNSIVAPFGMTLDIISNRGAVVYPSIENQMTDCIDNFRCRFMYQSPDYQTVAAIQAIEKQYTWCHIEKLYDIDKKAGYTKASGGAVKK